MKTEDVLSQVEEISHALVLAGNGDTEPLGQVAAMLEDLAGALRESGNGSVATAAETAAGIARSCQDFGRVHPAAMDTLVKAIEGLQYCLSGECTPAEAGLLSQGLDPDSVFDMQGEPADGPDPAAGEAPVDTQVPAAEDEGLNLSPLVDDNIVGEFLARQSDSLYDVEKLVLAIESGPADEDVEALKRWFHTLKGEGGLLGLTTVAEICHAAEDMMAGDPLPACVDRLLEVKDWLQACFDFLSRKGPEPTAAESLIARLREGATEDVAGPGDEPAAELAAPEAPVAADAPGDDEVAAAPEVVLPDYTAVDLLAGDVGLIQDFVEEANEHLDAAEAHLLTLESNPRESEALNAVFRGFHTIKGLAGFVDLEHVKELAHKAENLLDQARKGELDLASGPLDLVFESVDMMKRLVAGVVVALGSDGHLTTEPTLPELVARLIAATSGETVAPAAAARPQPEPEPVPTPAPERAASAAPPAAGRSGFIPLANLAKKKTAPAPADPAPVAPAAPPAPSAPPAAAKDGGITGRERTASSASVKVKEAVRVDAERLDRLIETIGELVIAESMVSQSPEVRSHLSVKLSKDLDHLDKISRELQEIGMSLRMVPVRPVFQKMARLVRDLAKKTGRRIEFTMSGEDTELDKNVVDRIGDPLVHMVRNAVDHGIEPHGADRVAAGKPEAGHVQLRAYHKGGNICIEIEDDGRGLDRDRILRKAYDRGLLREGEVPPDRDIFNLIFEPGFSTAKEVTDISGRGVGMDVVRRNIEELRGTCEITSEPGKGSVFSIRLPLTLAIIEGMVVSCGSEHYIVPTLSVVRLVRPREGEVTRVFGRGEMLAFADEHLPLFRLHRLFNVANAKTDSSEAVVVVVEDEGKKIGLLADDLLGQQSIVIKSLGETMQNNDGVAGGAIMSNGTVALILDVAGLIRVAHTGDGAVATSQEN